MELSKEDAKKNEEFLVSQQKWLGFGEKLNSVLTEGIKAGNSEFVIRLNDSFKAPGGKEDQMTYDLNYKKSEESGRYFLQSFDATLKANEGRANDLTKNFYVHPYDKDFPKVRQTVTAAEAYNLLDSRFVLKERIAEDKVSGDKVTYMGWQYLNNAELDKKGQPKIDQYHERYGYSLNEAIKKNPIKEFESPQAKEEYLHRLEKGYLVPATFIVGDKEVTKLTSANPQFKNLDVYDENGIKERQNQQTRESQTTRMEKQSAAQKQEEPVEKKKSKGRKM